MKVKVIREKVSVNNKPAKVGDVVDVDENTCRNLCKKGFVEASDAEAKAVDLGTGSVLSEETAEAQIERIEAERKAAKDAAKKNH
jgi:hypothetical protein